jgi:hypothetical protein
MYHKIKRNENYILKRRKYLQIQILQKPPRQKFFGFLPPIHRRGILIRRILVGIIIVAFCFK